MPDDDGSTDRDSDLTGLARVTDVTGVTAPPTRRSGRAGQRADREAGADGHRGHEEPGGDHRRGEQHHGTHGQQPQRRAGVDRRLAQPRLARRHGAVQQRDQGR